MSASLKDNARFWLESILNSYSQIFFSLDKTLGCIIVSITCINPFLGACGLAAVCISNGLAYILRLPHDQIREGLFGFNALLVGLALGYEYTFNLAFIPVFLSAMALLMLMTIFLRTAFVYQRLPYFTIPFLLTYWLVYLACGSFANVTLQDQYAYTFNYTANASRSPMYILAHSMDTVAMPLIISSYFKTLASTFFQNSVLAGMLVAAGLIAFSRISFTLSVIGYAGAFLCFMVFGLDPMLLTEHLVGINFIFMAIVLGCFFVVPSRWSYLLVVFLTPILTIFYIGLQKLLLPFQLKGFTLSFSLLSLLVIYFLRTNIAHHFVQLVTIQYYSAEKTMYKHLTASKRFAHSHLAKIRLPVWGEWKVSQGYSGSITHLGEWSQALDFVITDEHHSTYQQPGTKCEDYYCYSKPVTAPLDGYVHDIVNSVQDNDIKDVNLSDNWGNSIILNHNNGLFTQLSHLKRNSFKVGIGEYVTKGTVLAACGNSGRSPEPHIHFQMQLSPNIGARTYPYPIAYFMEGTGNSKQLRTFEVPREGTTVSNIDVAELLLQSYTFTPGATLQLTDTAGNTISWHCLTDAYNRTYLHCAKTGSTLWFINDGVMFYCYDFEGDTTSLLFNFYIANYRVLLAVYRMIEITDTFPLIHFSNRFVLLLQDFFAPFYLFTTAQYSLRCTECDNPTSPKEIRLQASATSLFLGRNLQSKSFEMLFCDNMLHEFSILHHHTKETYKCALV
jgi:urea transporter/murein DD-endopeptidase MepM/ murein hydrolase activator NlpD